MAESEEETQYEVEAIWDDRMNKNVREYLVKWVGYDSDEVTISCAPCSFQMNGDEHVHC